MANGKAMTVGEMASLFLDPATPVRIDAFDGSHFGPADADLKVKIATPNCMYQLLAHPNEIRHRALIHSGRFRRGRH